MYGQFKNDFNLEWQVIYGYNSSLSRVRLDPQVFQAIKDPSDPR